MASTSSTPNPTPITSRRPVLPSISWSHRFSGQNEIECDRQGAEPPRKRQVEKKIVNKERARSERYPLPSILNDYLVSSRRLRDLAFAAILKGFRES
jgi:hypothetical protein